MGGPRRKPKKGEGTFTDSARYVPSKVHVNHARNFSRADVYPVPPELTPHIEGDTFCFTLAEVEERLADFRANEQITPGTIYLTLTGDAFLVDGYLRHAAWLLAEVRGELGKKKNVFKAEVTSEPKSEEDWDALRRRNRAENKVRKTLTPLDVAYDAQRLLAPRPRGQGLNKKDAAAELGFSNPRQMDRYLRLLKLPPDVQLKVHTGAMKMGKALEDSTETGQGGSPGKRSGTKHTAMRRALEFRDVRKPPASVLNADQLVQLTRLLAGEEIHEDELDADVEDWHEWIDAPKELKRNKPPVNTPVKETP